MKKGQKCACNYKFMLKFNVQGQSVNVFFFFFLFFLESFNLWRSFLMIDFYYQIKIPIDFWYRWKLNPKSFIQSSKTLLPKLTGIQNVFLY